MRVSWVEGEGQRITFEEAYRRYAEFKRQRDAGFLEEVEFGARLKDLMVQDEVDGRWWSKSRQSGKWHYHDGEKWIEGNPPGYEPQQATTDARSTPQSIATDAPTLEQEPAGSAQKASTVRRNLAVPPWYGLLAGILGLAGLISIPVWTFVLSSDYLNWLSAFVSLLLFDAASYFAALRINRWHLGLGSSVLIGFLWCFTWASIGALPWDVFGAAGGAVAIISGIVGLVARLIAQHGMTIASTVGLGLLVGCVAAAIQMALLPLLLN